MSKKPTPCQHGRHFCMECHYTPGNAAPGQCGPYGRGDLMVIAAFRYCLGRQTYIVNDCTDWLISIWPQLRDKAKKVIQRDLEEAFARDDDARAEGQTYRLLGMDCDRRDWERIRQLWRHEDAER